MNAIMNETQTWFFVVSDKSINIENKSNHFNSVRQGKKLYCC